MIPTASPDDIFVFSDHCVFVRSLYMHGKILFEHCSAKDTARMQDVAPIFFGDLNRLLIERLILEVCKITDPAQGFRKNDNHTVAFLLQHYDFSSDPATAARLGALHANLQAFRQKLLPARNKIVSHSDRAAIMEGNALGGASDAEWQKFWLDLRDIVSLMRERVFGTPFNIFDVSMISDADGLLKTLKHAECFRQVVHEAEPALTHRYVDLAMTD